MAEHFDIIIIGGGPAGLTAAIYARRAGKTVLLLEKEGFGGQIASSPNVENFPGFPSISGAELADRLYDQACGLGAQIDLEEVLEVQDGSIKTVSTDYGSYSCTALILATGMKHRTLGLPGEDALSGISFCAVCDGAFYAGKDVVVCGGGNTALQDALFLSELCRHVTVIHRRTDFRGDPILVERLQRLENVSFILPAEVVGLHSQDSVLTGLVLQDTISGTRSNLAVSGLFEAVGQLPEQRLAASLVPVDADGFVPAGENCLTPAKGIFVAGDCRSKEVRQLTTACADGAVAALAACKYCSNT
ncbi:thioredoxin reductase (NADPH) [Oscillibacter sp. PC13]|uniref:NAD(P)/FAD-dependent oxidoreductase n=1 Tax=Oscillibacter sp. PC13 TaxID=1855299 RepID=UPI0008EC4725|nr:FAD-dependent oxidoreductase [Oscillibacter sp. PC13]SFP99421.1 thioredoxin reductase (NADPH) [Oscillibacter sp. PC13]